jgi:hypothetical protein
MGRGLKNYDVADHCGSSVAEARLFRFGSGASLWGRGPHSFRSWRSLQRQSSASVALRGVAQCCLVAKRLDFVRVSPRRAASRSTARSLLVGQALQLRYASISEMALLSRVHGSAPPRRTLVSLRLGHARHFCAGASGSSFPQPLSSLGAFIAVVAGCGFQLAAAPNNALQATRETRAPERGRWAGDVAKRI